MDKYIIVTTLCNKEEIANNSTYKIGTFAEITQKIQVRNLISNLIFWCRWPESNRHGLFNRRILSPVRLPIPPHLHLLII